MSVFRDGAWLQVPLHKVKVGDRVRSNHGDRIATDGEVYQGFALCNESHLTGESELIKNNLVIKFLRVPWLKMEV